MQVIEPIITTRTPGGLGSPSMDSPLTAVVQTNEPPSAGRSSPACTHLVTFHNHSLSHARVWDVLNGHLVADLSGR